VIVTCERCSTQFRLDEARIPEAGVRVRCSRCKYAFHVDRPGQSEEARVQRAATQALAPEVPEPTQDLSDEESDWEFNVERESAANSAADAASEDSPFGAEQRFDHSDDDDTMPESGLEIDAGVAETSSAEPAGDLFGDGSEPVGVPSGLDLAGAGSAPVPEPAAKTPRPASEGARAEDLGRPEDWDFFADVPAKASSAPVAEPVRHATPKLATPRHPPVDLDAEPREARPRWLLALGSGAGWLAVAACCVFGFYEGLTPHVAGSEPAATRLENAEISEVRGRTVENLMVGDIYVVTAVLRASGAAPPRISVALLDANGERLRRPPVALGLEPPETLLRQADPAALAQFAERFPLAGGSRAQRVAAVIPALPVAARAFRFVAEEADPLGSPSREAEGAAQGQDPEAERLPEPPAPDAAG
jgi:predicted Zn finger-like uncharacterized protein